MQMLQPTTRRRHTAAAVVTGVALALSGCGGEGRPSVEEISKELTASDSVIPVPQTAADCFAELLHDSDVSDETLNAITDRETGYEGSDEDRQELATLINDLTTACADELASK